MESESILLEVDVSTLRRLLERKVVSLEDIHSIDAQSKQRLRRLLLEVLKRQLGQASTG